ncbi:hypothetical protein [Aquimarina sp. 2201CG5-10]|uniref:hypothetical protein n=1 Tax=Aquimarina callyspongiae TaxID=3098150 RepID=UPI002AB460C9|nr:hypothetical protein [Aquimarina sp. 2201CG5-10]MDY8136428.1 hypothetical protein [Aquimarina sp. 2201CG5-10]
MNKYLFIMCFGLLILSSGNIVAQQNNTSTQREMPDAQSPEDLVEIYNKKLGLSEQQKTALHKLFTERKNNPDKSASISKGNTFDDKLKKILTKEQFEKFYKKTRKGIQ